MKFRLREQARSQAGHALACGSELAHEESGANAEYLLISQSVFANKFAHAGHALACGSELAHEESGANAEYLLIGQSVFASKLAPTQATHTRVGVSLLTKSPAQTLNIY
ncbi:hypothetical protein A584_13605 [Pseudomonas syringae pv. theae ICMP 3923]|nr:hypothetical protein A584_13605 [Pseudomonas syringae pv. theae ICMP 3923]